jgi:hypothetical protein
LPQDETGECQSYPQSGKQCSSDRRPTQIVVDGSGYPNHDSQCSSVDNKVEDKKKHAAYILSTSSGNFNSVSAGFRILRSYSNGKVYSAGIAKGSAITIPPEETSFCPLLLKQNKLGGVGNKYVLPSIYRDLLADGTVDDEDQFGSSNTSVES